MKVPSDGVIYSVNQGNMVRMKQPMKDYISYCMSEDQATQRPYSLRYIGSMVADMHRTLIKGGIFIYPADSKNTEGKLRLLYECNPMAFIIEHAGGKASTGEADILDIEPTDLHQRVPIIIGSSNMVDKALEFQS